jgi:probable HAF family extracellular repeat protein
VALAVTLGASAQPAATYTVTDLGTLGGDCFAMDINLLGQIVGTCRAGAGPEQAFLYGGGIMSPLGTLGGAYSFANAINQLGDTTGDSATAARPATPYIWRGA